MMGPRLQGGRVTPELKPCPFCGSKADSVERIIGDQGYVECYCPTPNCPGNEIGGDYGRTDAESWNRRTPDLTEALARLKALEEEVRPEQFPASRQPWSTGQRNEWADEIAAIRKLLGGGA